MLLVGVADDGEVTGWNGDDLDALASKITDSLRLHLSELRAGEVDGKKVLVARVPEAQAPVAYRGRYYQRVGATTREIPPSELTRFLMERAGETWDAVENGEGFMVIAETQIEAFAHLAKDRLPHVSKNEGVSSVLGKLNLVKSGNLTRAALLLFGENPQATFFSARVHMGRFKDAVTIVDDKWFGGTLFDQVEAVMNQFRQYLQVRYDIPFSGRGGGGAEGAQGMQRKEVWDYPLTALEEAVINALIHRDYGRLGNVEVRVFDDRVVVSNPGGLPKPLTIEELQREGHDSIRRNPLLAQTFYFASLARAVGNRDDSNGPCL